MWMYITAEDAFGETASARREPKPLHTIPSTISALHDMGMRHHIRPGVRSRPGVAGTVAYLQPPRMTLANRLALAATGAHVMIESDQNA